LALLVSIYGSKELFVNEYRLMLAEKLLASNLQYNTDHVVHTVELLKLRFGESNLRNCEVMIKDIDDSKRTNNNVHSTIKDKQKLQYQQHAHHSSGTMVDAIMLSHIFWPTLQHGANLDDAAGVTAESAPSNENAFKHHPRIHYALEEYGEVYSNLKNPRRLHWLQSLGTISLELDVVEEPANADSAAMLVTKEFTVAPALATLIMHFQDQPRWTAEDLSNETGMPELQIQKRMLYWVNARVVLAMPSSKGDSSLVYVVASVQHLESAIKSSLDGSGVAGGLDGNEDDDMDGAGGGRTVASASVQAREEMSVFESYIIGMLTNLRQLPLSRIHEMLKMCVAGSDHKYSKTPQQLNAFLQQLCRQEKLECGPDGRYKLLKK
jgi:anaphase-promoting complex subunit 2